MKICKRCHRFTYTDKHHIYGVENNREDVVDLCRECHMWCHQHPREAREQGFMKRFDGIIRKKESSPNKWKLKKSIANL